MKLTLYLVKLNSQLIESIKTAFSGYIGIFHLILTINYGL